MTDARAFRGFRFPAEVILWAVRWYLQFPVSYRDLERMLADRGVEVDHTSLYRWVQRFAPGSRSGCGGTCAPAAGRGTSMKPTFGSAAVALPLPGRRRDRPDDRLPAQRQARQEGGQALLPPGARPGEHPQPADRRYRPAEELPGRAAGDEARGRAVAVRPAPARAVAEQPGRAGPPPRQAPNRADARLPGLLDGAADPGRGGGDGDAGQGTGACRARRTTSRRSGPSSTGSSASPPEPRRAGRSSSIASQRNRTKNPGWLLSGFGVVVPRVPAGGLSG